MLGVSSILYNVHVGCIMYNYVNRPYLMLHLKYTDTKYFVTTIQMCTVYEISRAGYALTMNIVFLCYISSVTWLELYKGIRTAHVKMYPLLPSLHWVNFLVFKLYVDVNSEFQSHEFTQSYVYHSPHSEMIQVQVHL